jgi:hypothetical protein
MSYTELHFKPRLRVLSEEQVDRLHLATLEVLERTGVQVTHPQALELLDGAGARVEGDRVRFPAWLVEDAIRQAPARVALGQRNGERSVFLRSTRCSTSVRSGIRGCSTARSTLSGSSRVPNISRNVCANRPRRPWSTSRRRYPQTSSRRWTGWRSTGNRQLEGRC